MLVAPQHLRGRRHGQGPTTYALEFVSDASEVLDESLGFDLAYFTTVTSLLLQFPAGDTYKFDVMLFDVEGDPIYTQEVRKPCSHMVSCWLHVVSRPI